MDEKGNSVMILEEIMRRIRKLAFENDTSISDIVHEALGEYLILREQEMNYYDLIYSIEAGMNKTEQFTVNTNLPNFSISVKSPLQYTFRPALRYEIELKRDGGLHIGKIKTILRSNDMRTLKSFSEFLNLWIEFEMRYVTGNRYEQIGYITDAGYFSRNIYMPGDAGLNAHAIGSAISDYVHVFDELFKHYFRHPGEKGGAVENMYVNCVKCGKLIV